MLQALSDAPRIRTRLPVELSGGESVRERDGTRVGRIKLGREAKAPGRSGRCRDGLHSHNLDARHPAAAELALEGVPGAEGDLESVEEIGGGHAGATPGLRR